MTTKIGKIETRAREIAGCLFDDAEGATLAERIQYCVDFVPLGTDGDLSDDDRAELRELVVEAKFGDALPDD